MSFQVTRTAQPQANLPRPQPRGQQICNNLISLTLLVATVASAIFVFKNWSSHNWSFMIGNIYALGNEQN